MAADPSSDLATGAPAPAHAADKKKSRQSERRRRRRKQKKTKAPVSSADAVEEDKPDSKPPVEIEVEYVPEEPDLADGLLANFESIFYKFTFKEAPAAEDGEKKEEAADAAKKGSRSDSDPSRRRKGASPTRRKKYS